MIINIAYSSWSYYLKYQQRFQLLLPLRPDKAALLAERNPNASNSFQRTHMKTKLHICSLWGGCLCVPHLCSFMGGSISVSPHGPSLVDSLGFLVPEPSITLSSFVFNVLPQFLHKTVQTLLDVCLGMHISFHSMLDVASQKSYSWILCARIAEYY